MMEFAPETQLRWILILIGLVIIAGVYLYTRHNERQQRDRDERKYPDGIDDIVDNDANDTFADVEEAPIQTDEDETSLTEADVKRQILVLYVKPASSPFFRGEQIAQVAQRQGLARGGGELEGFFEYRTDETGDIVWFYLASMFEPGTFEWQQLETYETEGISLFTLLPGRIPAMDVFQRLLLCAENIAAVLDGKILDDQQQPFTDEARQAAEEKWQAIDARNKELF